MWDADSAIGVSIPSECQRSRDIDLGQVNFAIASVTSFYISNTLLRRSPSISTYKIAPSYIKIT